jgi:BirA family biotin operon repressor/biotin-[acetyl-CoA-carboxylase] ligase
MPPFTIIQLETVDSTNRYALQRLGSLRDGLIISAEKQTEGYGRLSRKWVSDVPNNMYMSIVLKPDRIEEKISILNSVTQYMAVVICDVFFDFQQRAEIKWPNDVLVHGKKIAGILGESAFHGNQPIGYVLGVGINLNMSEEVLRKVDQPATSLNLLTGRAVNKGEFLDRLVVKFFRDYQNFLEKGFVFIKEKYSQRSGYLGKRIRVSFQNCKFEGIARGFSDEGALCVLAGGGEIKEFIAGDLTLI